MVMIIIVVVIICKVLQTSVGKLCSWHILGLMIKFHAYTRTGRTCTHTLTHSLIYMSLYDFFFKCTSCTILFFSPWSHSIITFVCKLFHV